MQIIYTLSNLVLYTLLLLNIVQPAGPFQKPNILWYAQNSQWVRNSIFQNGKLIFPFQWKILGIFHPLNLKCGHPYFYVNSLNFQQWNTNSDITFQFVLRFKIEIFVYFNRFPNSRKCWKLGFVNVAVVGLCNFSSLWKWRNIGIFEC